MARLVVLLALALIIFGPQDLLRIARTLEWTMDALRRATEDVTGAIRAELEVLERGEATHPTDV